MPSLPIAISPSYIDWTYLQCIRELLQNAMDAQRKGYPMMVKHFPRTDTLIVETDGTTLSPSTLVLGETEKRDDDEQAGQFGEGYKLAIIRLLQLGHNVTIKNGEENWTPVIRYAEQFKTRILFMDTHKASARRGERFIKYEVTGITRAMWEQVEANTLFIGEKSFPAIDCSMNGYPVGRILTGSEHTNKLFVKGLFVCQFDNYRFGYDMFNVKLDRDRKLADPWSLKQAICGVLVAATESGKLSAKRIVDLLMSECEESEAFASCYVDSTFNKIVAQEFKERYGEHAVPVTTDAERLELGHFGKFGVMTTRGMKRVFEMAEGSIENMKRSLATQPKQTYCLSELTDKEHNNLYWAQMMIDLSCVSFSLSNVQIVDFHAENLSGTYSVSSGQVRLARKLLSSRLNLLATYVHEVAHHAGRDGSVDHEREIESIMASIVCQLSPA